MLHKPTNDMLEELPKDVQKKVLELEEKNLHEVEVFIKDNKWDVSPRCSCGRVATIGLDCNGCLFLQYCCDGYVS